MFENGKQKQQLAGGPGTVAALPPCGDTRRQWDPSFAWARRLRLVALHARIPGDLLLPVADSEADGEDCSSDTANKEKGRRFDCKLPILDTRAGRGLPPFCSTPSSN